MEQQPVYPRWRGEHKTRRRSLRRNDGLSPLARGTLNTSYLYDLYMRFIPAGAGNTFAELARHGWMPVYPRWRGEHLTASKRVARRDGLSPLARGTH